MNTRLKKSFLMVAILMLLIPLISLHPANAQPIVTQQAPDAASNPLEYLGRASGIDPRYIEIGAVETLILADGRQIVLIKGIDRRTSETLSAAFDGDRVVDPRAEQQAALQAWRTAHGALSPALVQKLAISPEGESFTVAVWLNASIESLPKPRFSQPAAKQPESTAGGDPAAEQKLQPDPSRMGIVQKSPSLPTPVDQIPADVLARANGAPAGHLRTSQPLAQKDPAQAAQDAPQTDLALMEKIETFKQQNDAYLRQQIAPQRQNFLDYCAAHNLDVQYASETAPLVVLSGLSRYQLQDLAWQSNIHTIYDASLPGGPSLDVARPTQNGNLLEDWGGYTGSGVNVAIVEGERASNVNPYLTIVETRDTGRTIKNHPTAVAGMLASFNSIFRGMAPLASVYSANGDDYTTIAALDAAMDWGSTRASVLNNSFWAADCGLSSAFNNIDRHMDYLVRYNYDLAVVASGNFNTLSCDGVNPGTFAASPGKGYNSLTVGNYQDQNTQDWSDDTMRASSSYNHSGMWKPEVAASGSVINSTLTASPWVGDTGSGTSYASPMVAGIAANMIQAAPGLMDEPEAVTAILMATALHNIEGSSSLSRLDGTGGVDASAALASVERGHYDDLGIDSSTTFPLTYTQYAYAGETVRFAIRWLSNPSGDYTSDPLPPDLDLRAFRQDGVTLLDFSTNSFSALEIVEFVAPASENYRFRIELYGSWSGGNTWLGIGWWCGVYRIDPDIGYSYPQATPLGTHLAVYPADWSPSNYWRAMGVRPSNGDHDLRLYSRSFFDNPGLREYLDASTAGTNAVDYIVVDGNHWPPSDQEQYHVDFYSGTGEYHASRSNLGVNLGGYGWYGPYSMGSSEVVKVFDVSFDPGDLKRIQIVPTGSNAADLAASLFKSSPGSSATWHKNRFEHVAFGDDSSATSATESLVYNYPDPFADYLGLVVHSNNAASGQFYILVQDLVFLPVVTR